MNGQIEFGGELHHNQDPFDGLLFTRAIINVFAVDEAAAEDVLLQLLAECVNHYKDISMPFVPLLIIIVNQFCFFENISDFFI